MRAREAERQALSARDDAAEQLRQAKRSEARASSVLKFFQGKVLSAARPKGQEGGLEPRRDGSRGAGPCRARDRQGVRRRASRRGVDTKHPRRELLVPRRPGEGARSSRSARSRFAGRSSAPRHPETVGAMNDLAIVLDRMGKFAEEQKILEEVVAVKRRTLGPEEPGHAPVRKQPGGLSWPCKACSKTRSSSRRKTWKSSAVSRAPSRSPRCARRTTWRSCDATSGGGRRLGLCSTSHSRCSGASTAPTTRIRSGW